MIRRLIFVLALLTLAIGLSAQRYIVGIPAGELEQGLAATSLNQSVHLLAELGYGILHYDASYVIAITPAESNAEFDQAVTLASFPGNDDLYLASKIHPEERPEIGSAGQVLLETRTFCIFRSDLPEAELRGLIAGPFLKMSYEPMRLADNASLQRYASGTRTDIAQLVSYVNSDSLIARAQNLQNFQTRYALAGNRLQVAQWIQQQFLNYGISNAHLESFTYQSTQQYNVVATITGTLYPDEYIIVGGHYDSTSNDTDPYLIAPGADDNASGTAATMEIARVMLQSGYQPPVSIRFMAFGCEERGLVGSYADAAATFNSGMDIRLMVNHDMLANNAGSSNWQVRLMPYDGSLDYNDLATQITDQYTSLTPYNGTMNSASSDSYTYWQRGHHAIYFFESEISPYYHKSQDVVANLNPGYFAEVVKASLACTVTFADMAKLPEPELLLEENYDYTAGTNLTSNGWTAFASGGTNPLKVVTPGLDYPEYPSVAANATSISGSGEDVLKRFAPVAANTVYASLLVNISAVNTTGDYFVHLSSSPVNSSYYRGRVFAKTNSSGNLAFGISNNGAISTAVFTGFDYSLNSTQLLVLKYEFVPGANNDLVHLFIDPDISSAEPDPDLTATDVITTEPVSLGTFEIRQGTAPDAPSAKLDGIRVARSWNELLDIQDETLPVELSSFTATVSGTNYVTLNWVSQSETNLRGYYILRAEATDQNSAQMVSPLIPATNTSQAQSYMFIDHDLYAPGVYWYWLECLDLDGVDQYFGPVAVDFIISDPNPPAIPSATELISVFPNPFNPCAYVLYSIGEDSGGVDVQIKIYNSKGQIVRSHDAGSREPGIYRFIWDGTDNGGSVCSSGVYYFRMRAGRETYQRKAVLLK